MGWDPMGSIRSQGCSRFLKVNSVDPMAYLRRSRSKALDVYYHSLYGLKIMGYPTRTTTRMVPLACILFLAVLILLTLTGTHSC